MSQVANGFTSGPRCMCGSSWWRITNAVKPEHVGRSNAGAIRTCAECGYQDSTGRRI